MSEPTACRETIRCTLPTYLQTSAHRGQPWEDESARLSDSTFLPLHSIVRAAQVLVIGDDPSAIAQQLRLAFPAPAHRVQVAGTGADRLEHVCADSPDIIVLGTGLPNQSGLEVYQQIRRRNARVPVVFVTAVRRADTAIAAIKDGAFDCLFQPLDLPLLRRVVGEALDVARRQRQPAAAEESGAEAEAESGMVGYCPAMGEVYKAIGRVAAQDVPVLITGESGTGKELVARAIHRYSRRADRPFLALNCAAIPEQLLESALFGHEKGAFTGADRRRIGKFEQCDGGTILLDEIGDVPLSLQAKVLRLVQEQAFERIGGNETVHTDVRLIAATHRDLKAWSAEGKFRPDLYYRLGVFTIGLPALRDRDDDLPLLVRHYVRRFSRELGRDVRHLAPEALERPCRYRWPGNVRELQSVLKQALLQASGPVLLPAFLPNLLGGEGEADAPTPTRDALGAETFVVRQRLAADVRDLYAEAHRQLDRQFLARVLHQTQGNILQAAQLLGIARQTLRLKLRDLGLSVTRTVGAEEDDAA